MGPKFSIIIPFFNSDSTLKRAIDSVITQDFSDWELILVNDGSTDKSEKVVQSFLDDDRIFYFYQLNKGVSAARNLGAEKAKGEWLIFLDSDDELRLNAIAQFYNSITFKGKPVDVVFSAFCKINNKSKIVSSTAKIPGSYCFFKESFSKLGGFDENISYGENSELFRRAEIIGFNFQHEEFVSVNYFESTIGGSKNLINIIRSNEYLLKKYSEYFEKHQREKAVYLQVIGVGLLRIGEFDQARTYFLKCLKINYLKPQFWMRFIVSSIPYFSRKIYPLNGPILQ